MATESEVLKELTTEVSKAAGVAAVTARQTLSRYLSHLARWTTEANAAEAAGNDVVAKKRRASIKGVKNAIVLDLATAGVEVTNKVERTVLSLVDGALAKLV